VDWISLSQDRVQCLHHVNTGSIKDGKLDQLGDYKLLSEDSASWHSLF
jgi:hypothetical protein